MLAHPKFYYLFKIVPSKYFSTEQRDALSEYLAYAAVEYRCLGILDWSVNIGGNEKILAVESEFMDLSARAGESHPIELWFGKRADAQAMRKKMEKQYPQLKCTEVYREVKRDWMKLWRKHYRPIQIAQNGEKLWIVPSWQKFSSKSKQDIVVRIHPGQAFGTGTHATTELCLRALLEYVPATNSKISILDFGSGTGILGIAALDWAKRKKIIAKLSSIEIDPEARKILERNKRINRKKFLSAAKIPSVGKFDLIFANVLAPVLIKERKKLVARLAKNGVLIISGILRGEAEIFRHQFIENMSKDISCKKIIIKDDWAALIMERPCLG